MSSNSFDFSNIQAHVSSMYELASTYVVSGFELLQKALPSLTAADAKTMIFGAAFFAAINESWGDTVVATAIGAFWGQNICDFGSKGIELFNAQSSQTKCVIVAGAVFAAAGLAALKQAGHLTNELLKAAAAAAVGLYAGFVLGKSPV